MKIERIRMNPHNYNRMKPEEKENLKQQIKEAKENNLPLFEEKIVVRKLSEESYELIDGEQRVTICKELGIDEIPDGLVIIKENMTEREILEGILRRRTRGSDVKPFKEAECLEALYKTGLTYEQIGKRNGLSKSRIIHIVQRLEIPQTIRPKLEGAPAHLIDEIATLHKIQAFEKVTEWALASPRTREELREHINSEEIQRLDIDKGDCIFRIEERTFQAMKEWAKDSVLPHAVEITVGMPEHETGICQRRAMDIMINILLKELLKKEKYL